MVLALAAVMGLLASALVYRLAVISAHRPAEEREAIVVASVSMTMADTVRADQVKLVQWPKASVPEGALRKVADAEGRVVRNSIFAGEPLLEARLAPQLSGRGGIMPMLVPRGLRGVTIKVDDAIRESGFILPGSHVDILVSMVTAGSSERFAKVILQNVQVLAAGQTVEMRDNKPVTVTTVTLALTPAETERLALAQTEGKLTLATRNLSDKQLVTTNGARPGALMGDGAQGARTGTAPPKAAPSRSESHSVTTVRGGKASEQEFSRNGGQSGWQERVKK
jgi:pilus assembly protein CpaB